LDRNHVLLATAWLCLPLVSATAQQPAATPTPATPAYQLQVTSRLVVLDVTVTDREGHLVNNLPRDAFRVYEDKVLQDVRSFEPPQMHLPPGNVAVHSTVELDRREPNAPVSILVLDEIGTSSQDESFARNSLEKYLNVQGDALDQPTMLIAVDTRRFLVLHDYTTVKKDLLNALDHHVQALPWRQGSRYYQGEQMSAAFASLMQVAQATAGHAGHKNMIWIGRGFPNVNPANVPPDLWSTIQSTIELCVNTLRDSRITLYTVDPAGVIVDPPDPDDDGFYDQDPFGGQVDFSRMAIATGGQVFYGRNDLDKLIATSLQDGKNFYTLSYTPSNHDENAKPFRNIQVRLADPNLIAYTRTGYYTDPAALASAPSTPARGRPSESMAALLNAANSSMPYDAVHIAVSAEPVSSAEPISKDKAVPGVFLISIPPSEVPPQTSDTGVTGADITLLVESFDKKGVLLHRTANRMTLQVPPDAARDTPVSVRTTVPLTPAAVRLRFVVRVEATGKIGADNFDLPQSGHP